MEETRDSIIARLLRRRGLLQQGLHGLVDATKALVQIEELWLGPKCSELEQAVRAELSYVRHKLDDLGATEPCGVFLCKIPRKTSDQMCAPCQAEFHEDPEAFK